MGHHILVENRGVDTLVSRGECEARIPFIGRDNARHQITAREVTA